MLISHRDAEVLDEFEHRFGKVGATVDTKTLRSFLVEQYGRPTPSIEAFRQTMYSIGLVTEMKGKHLTIVRDGFAWNPELHKAKK